MSREYYSKRQNVPNTIKKKLVVARLLPGMIRLYEADIIGIGCLFSFPSLTFRIGCHFIYSSRVGDRESNARKKRFAASFKLTGMVLQKIYS